MNNITNQVVNSAQVNEKGSVRFIERQSIEKTEVVEEDETGRYITNQVINTIQAKNERYVRFLRSQSFEGIEVIEEEDTRTYSHKTEHFQGCQYLVNEGTKGYKSSVEQRSNNDIAAQVQDATFCVEERDESCNDNREGSSTMKSQVEITEGEILIGLCIKQKWDEVHEFLSSRHTDDDEKRDAVMCKDKFGGTSLNWACRYGAPLELIIILIRIGGLELLLHHNNLHMTALHCALFGDLVSWSVIETLLKSAGERSEELVKMGDDMGHTSLHYACRYGAKPDIIKMLVNKGGKALAMMQTATGLTALHYSCELITKYYAPLETIRILAENGGEELLLSKDKNGKMPFDIAVRNGASKTLKRYLEPPSDNDHRRLSTTRMISSGDNGILDICALLSAIAYDVETKDDLDMKLKTHLGPWFDDVRYRNVRPDPTGANGDKGFDQRTISTVIGKTLVVTWCGTKGLRDLATDVNANPISADLWHQSFPNIRVHGGMYATIQNQCVRLFPILVDLVKAFNVDKIVFTGHSLGAGLAQIALMAIMGQQEVRFENIRAKQMTSSDIEEILGVNSDVKVTCKAFASPMIFSFDELNDFEFRVLEKYRRNSSVFIFGQDPVPRMPAHIDFWISALRHETTKAACNFIEKLIPLTKLISDSVNNQVSGGVTSIVDGLYIDDTTMQLAKSYKHASTLIHISVPSDCKDRTLECDVITNDLFMQKSFSGAEHDLIECHSIFPYCLGKYNCQTLDEEYGLRNKFTIFENEDC